MAAKPTSYSAVHCRQCGKELPAYVFGRPKKFCSSRCQRKDQRNTVKALKDAREKLGSFFD